ncbi:hypothetical protein QBC43DRAFT_297119 [Cladorrhinum sp. PSN259]|nr:hypothetical protein QBC43DRAFT_297119 [Cladorrhinum sp. PSN259]
MATENTSTPQFDISPEKRATISQYLYRQLFVTPAPITPTDVSLKGKSAIVTGVNSTPGLGLEIARLLLSLGLSNLIIAVRTLEKGESAKQLLLKEFPSQKPTSIQVWPVNLSNPESIVAFADRAKDATQLPSLDMAILNAGIFKFVEDYNPKTQYEEDIQTNYLSNMLLALLLIPIIENKKSDPHTNGRICIVSSDTAAWAKFAINPPGPETPILPLFKKEFSGDQAVNGTKEQWDCQDRYATSKLLGQLFISHLCSRVYPFSSDGKGVTINLPNPGFCYGSEMGRELAGIVKVAMKVGHKLVGRTCSVGARSVVRAVVNVGEEDEGKWHGVYVEDAKVQPMPPLAYKDEGREIAARLYEETIGELEKYYSKIPENTVIGVVRNKFAVSQKIASDPELCTCNNIHLLEADVTDYPALKAASIKASNITGGKLDILIANAGIVPMFDAEVFEVNVIGNVHLFNVFVPLVLAGAQKKVIVIPSALADTVLTNELDLENGGLYAASKAAMNLLVAKYSAQYKNDGVLFLSICPGMVEVGHYKDATPEQAAALGGITQKFLQYAPNFSGPSTPDQSVQDIRKVIDEASIEKGLGGDFISHLGGKRWL